MEKRENKMENKKIVTGETIASDGMFLLKSHNVRNHKLGNNAAVHSGMIEKKELNNFKNYLPSKIAYFIYNFMGCDNCE